MALRRALLAVAAAALLAVIVAAPARAQGGGGGLGAVATPHHRRAGALDGRAMWVWQLADTDGGDLEAIVARAHADRITTLLVKSSDGTTWWSQFDPALVAALHHAGLRVCAWQYVYGDRPGEEAGLGARAVDDGADCLVIDAEVQYDGKYVAAQRYVDDLRRRIGARYPVALAGLPYVDLHPAFPYSVFLGPGGAQVDMPQMYWRAIGTSVDAVFAHTYAFNLPYDRPIDPLGQLYGNPPARQVARFRALAVAHGARGVSWWDWQSADDRAFSAMASPLPTGSERLPRAVLDTPMAAVGEGAHGDLVVWLQEHLDARGARPAGGVAVSGVFGPRTALAVEAFQSARGLLPDGIVGPETWSALLRLHPLAVRWVHRGRRTVAAGAPGGEVATAPGGPSRAG